MTLYTSPPNVIKSWRGYAQARADPLTWCNVNRTTGARVQILPRETNRDAARKNGEGSGIMYHFTNIDGTLGHGDERRVMVGETLTVSCEPVLCKSGLHASPRIIDALRYAPGLRLWEVQLSGHVVEDNDKSVATERTAIRDLGDMTRIAIRLAQWCARRANQHAAAAAAAYAAADAAYAAAAAAAYAAYAAEITKQEQYLNLALVLTKGD